jgi:beta-phosphoglucomutase-like phosphatase (HAD superfamily)
MFKIKLVIFDIGGTIIEDNGEVIEAFADALATNGLRATESELKERKGASKQSVITHFVERQLGKQSPGNDARIVKTYADFKTLLENRFTNGGVKPIRGAASTFSWLQAQNIVCATTTGFYRSVTDRILQSVGWQHKFGANICSDDVKIGRPAPFMCFQHPGRNTSGRMDYNPSWLLSRLAPAHIELLGASNDFRQQQGHPRVCERPTQEVRQSGSFRRWRSSVGS